MYEKPSGKPTEKLVLLADLDLMEMPLESLRLFHGNASILSISRDFSLQFFITRLQTLKDTGAAKLDEKKDDKKAKPADKKPATAAVPAEPLPDGAIIVDHSGFKYLIDVYNEASTARLFFILKSLFLSILNIKYSKFSSVRFAADQLL